ncbi:hypothetical protein DYB35_003930, partial [Aphanomyces astaci]
PPFNLTLWTLRVELEGSLFTMAVCVMLSKLRYRHRVVACLVALPIFHNRFEYAANYGGVDTLIRLIFEKEHARMLHRLGSVLILYTVCWSAWLQRVFQSRLCRYLGRISFCVYVVHWPIMLFMGDYVKPWAQGQGWTEETGKRLAAAACYVASHAVAHVATVYVDEPYVKWLRALERRLEMNIAPKPFPRHG